MAALFKRQNKELLLLNPNSITPNPNQPRVVFNEIALYELANSIRKNGIIQPLVVRKADNGRYELISGERRLRAAIQIGMLTVPCVLLNIDNQHSAVLALLENIQRENLNCFEEAKAINKLICELNLSQQEAAETLGKAQSTIANKLRLLNLSEKQQESITKSGLTERHARALLRIKDSKTRDNMLNEVIINGYNVVETERQVDKLICEEENKAGQSKTFIIRDVRLFVNSINKTIEYMRESGFEVKSERTETDTHFNFKVTIPKATV